MAVLLKSVRGQCIHLVISLPRCLNSLICFFSTYPACLLSRCAVFSDSNGPGWARSVASQKPNYHEVDYPLKLLLACQIRRRHYITTAL